MGKISKAEANKAYEDGVRDKEHGGNRNPPNNESWTSLFMSDRSLETNAEYHKGYDSAKPKK